MCECRQFFHHIFFELSQLLRNICQRIVCILLVIPLFYFGFWILRDSGPSLLVACSSLRSNTEPEDGLEAALFPETCSASLLNESCDNDVRGRNASRIGGQPWNDKRYVIVRLAINTLLMFGQSWLLVSDPLIGVSVVFAKLAWR